MSTKLSDEYHSNTISEILQKVKEKRASPTPEKDTDQQKENERILDISRKDSVDDKNENTNDVLRVIDNSSKLQQLIFENYKEGLTVLQSRYCDIFYNVFVCVKRECSLTTNS